MTTLRLSRFAMACDFEIILSGEDAAYIRDVATLALDEIERLDAQLSCFRATSEVSYLNAEAARRAVIVEPGLFGLIRLAADVWRDTDGAFDITAGPLIELWRDAEMTGHEPSEKAIDDALREVGMSHVLLDDATNSVRFDLEGLQINLGAIGKGYAVRRAAEILREYRVESALISGGKSTIQAIGAQIDGEAWNVGIRHPSKFDERVATLQLLDRAMSTSGGPEQRDEAVEEKFEHILDPTTGRPAESNAASVTAIADDAALTDALSTAFYLKGMTFAEHYCRAHPGVKAMFVEWNAASGDWEAKSLGTDSQ